MVLGINLSRNTESGDAPGPARADVVARIRQKLNIRTQALLVLTMALVIVIVTAVALLLIRHSMREQVAEDLTQDLNHSVITFHNLQAERFGALERENALLAELPTLKALMTSGDSLTIQDGAVEFWQLSGNDLFALADPAGRVVAAYTKGATPDAGLSRSLETLLRSPEKHHLIEGRSLYACSSRPLYFGNDVDGTLLGYVISGVSIERTVRQISEPTGVEATFFSNGQILASTLPPAIQTRLKDEPLLLSGTRGAPSMVRFGRARFLAATEDLSSKASSSLQLVVLKSFDAAERKINRIDQIVLSAGMVALLSGTVLMIVLSRLLTRPLEDLSKSVRAFGMGDGNYRIPRYGTQEVRQLSAAFAGMRDEIQRGNRALLESERLATIGRMASSVSHDLRHYLAAVYANAEFLASGTLRPEERAEIFNDIRTAVLGTTDMIESLLIFSRTGNSVRRSPELMATLVEHAVTLMRTHPDGDRVKIVADYGEPAQTAAIVDGKQVERAVFNLLLNACQAVRGQAEGGTVTVFLESLPEEIVVNVIDTGVGVPESVRKSMFEPFVSEGKQKGTGLGLTLAHCIALDHGGAVVLLSSRPEETIFQLKVARELRRFDTMPSSESNDQGQVTAHEKVRK
jgi:signal transduction histidine kinase